MKSIDFSRPGGFPLTQDRLAYLQTAYSEVLQAIIAMGGAGPFIISGMAISGGGDTVSSGWFYYNGDIIQFTGGTVVPTGGDVPEVVITPIANPLTYNDGSTPTVIFDKTAALTHGPGITDATHFPVSALIPFGVNFGQNNRESTWQSIAVSTDPSVGGVTGTIYYKKDFIANTLQIRAVLLSNNAQNFHASPGALFYIMGVLPGGYIPNNMVNFTGYYYISSLIKDDVGQSWIHQVNCTVNPAGQIGVNWIKPDISVGGYGIQFNTVIPLD
jgi:hypothetical protein